MDLKQPEAFFFEAMRRGWASNIPQPVFNFVPGQKTYQYIGERLWLEDSFFVTPGSKSSYGTTVIWTVEKGLRERPVWVMHYGGWYEKSVIPLLKRALMRNYSEGIFLGGRGPIILELEGEDHTLQYLNWNEENDFTNFNVYEQIIAASPQVGQPGKKMGEHHYFGGMFK